MSTKVTHEEAERARASLMARFIPCPACEIQQAGPIHRTSAQLWQGRAERARRHEGTDPVSHVTLENADRHLAAIGG